MNRLLSMALLALVMVWVSPALAAKRVALVIGNSAYQSVDKLANPTNDAAAIAESLKRIGFSSIVYKTDLDYRDFRRALSQFSRLADGADIALIYYAGHGIEVDKRNYLLPVDARLQSARDVELEALSLDVVMTTLEGATKLRLVVLDSCRDNPFRARMSDRAGTRSVGRGLARVEAPSNTLVAYAAREGTTADDGTGDHSPYTEALLSHLESPGLEINFLFRRVRDSVLAATGGRQEPFVYGSLSSEAVYLRPPADVEAGESAYTPPARPPLSPAARVWADVKTSDSEPVLEAFIKQFPDGVYAELANARLKELAKRKVAVGAYPEQPQAKPVAVFVPAEDGDYRLTTKGDMGIHAEASDGARLLATSTKRRFVRLAGTVQGAGWSKVEWAEQKFGYVRSSFIGERIEDPENDATLKQYIEKANDWVGAMILYRARLRKHLSSAQSGHGQFQEHAGIYRMGWDTGTCQTGYKGVSGEGFLGPGYWAKLTVIVWSEGSRLMWAHPAYTDHATYQMGSAGNSIDLEGGKGRFRSHRAYHTQNKTTEWFGFNATQMFISNDNSSFKSLYRCEVADLDGRTMNALDKGLRHYLTYQSGLLFEPLLAYSADEDGGEIEPGFDWDTIELNEKRPEGLPASVAPTHASRVTSLKLASAAETGGLRKGDLVYAVDGQVLSDKVSLYGIQEGWKDGQSVKLGVWREGESVDLTLTLPTRFKHFQNLVARARAGDPDAAYETAQVIKGWRDVVRPEGNDSSERGRWARAQAGAWYRKAAAKGHVKAMVALGKIYDGSDPKFAIEWYRKAISKGDADAMHGLAEMYLDGDGFPAKAPDEAVKWYAKAAALGRIGSMTKLAELYAEGDSIGKDATESAKWYRKAAESGDVSSMFNIGSLYEKGEGVSKDYAAAKDWYEKAVAEGSSDAEYALGEMHYTGRGVPKNLKEAARLFGEAKDGNWDALTKLSKMHDRGEGAKRDPEQAAKLFFERIKDSYDFDDDDVKKYFVDRTVGWSGEAKRAFQRQLRDAGLYKGGIDGAFGNGTRRAVKELSKRK